MTLDQILVGVAVATAVATLIVKLVRSAKSAGSGTARLSRSGYVASLALRAAGKQPIVQLAQRACSAGVFTQRRDRALPVRQGSTLHELP